MTFADNKQMLYVLDTINDAIADKKKISFLYNDYDINYKLKPRRDIKYIVSPYQMVANNGHYYLIANYDAYDDISHYRLDRMTCVEILSERAKPKKEIKDFQNGFSLPKHMAEHIYMYSGPSVPVKIITEESMMNELVDWLGKDLKIRKTDVAGQIEVRFKCNEESMFYWALQYGPFIEVLEPVNLRLRIKNAISEMAKKYEG